MKRPAISDEEFLRGVYEKIAVLQQEQLELQAVKQRQLRLLRRRIGFLTALALGSVPLWVLAPKHLHLSSQALTYLWSAAVLTAGIIFEQILETGSDLN